VRLIVGLGNPGPAYRHTRHNVGFEVLDRLAVRLETQFGREKFSGQIAEAKVDGRKVLLLKPLTFMNLSGQSVAQAARYHADGPSEILVVYDEIDLPLGKVRLRKGGSGGTHNGMNSVIECLGTEEVPRLRVGVGAEMHRGERVGHVLGKFRPDEREAIDAVMNTSVDACLCCIRDGLDTAMNRYN
jgi:PTH1 family peptidyl-tRNA hydrolase